MIWKTTSSSEPVLPRFGGEPIRVVRSRRSRRLRLSIDSVGGTVRLSLPMRQALAPALAWAETRRDWVEDRLRALPERKTIAPGSVIEVADEQLVVDWREDRPRRVSKDGQRLIVGGPIDRVETRVLRHLWGEALGLLEAETRALAAASGLRLTRVSVGDARSRWGSCGTDGHVRYSWRLILAPGFVRRSVVAHEVAHLREHNHGPAFHALAEQLLGESHAPASSWLKRHGTGLHWVGR